MKRRKFIVSTSLSTLVLGLTPMVLTGGPGRSTTGTIELPNASGQIRHGMFTPEQTYFVHLEERLKIYGKQIFFKNGIEKGDADLVSITFELEGVVHCITCIGDRVFIGAVECFAKQDERLKIIEKNGKTISFLQGYDLEKEQTQIKGHLIPIQGDILLNSEPIDNDVAIELNSLVDLGSNGGYKLLFIEN